MRSCVLPILLTLGCAPPPLVEVEPADVADPFIALLFPEPGSATMEIVLDDDCVLRQLVVVEVDDFEVVVPEAGLVDEEGQGHWHGGIDGSTKYCASGAHSCIVEDETVVPGNSTLYVELQTNTHGPLGIRDQIEIEIVAPAGVTCP